MISLLESRWSWKHFSYQRRTRLEKDSEALAWLQFSFHIAVVREWQQLVGVRVNPRSRGELQNDANSQTIDLIDRVLC